MDVFHVVSQLARKSSKDTITEERMLKAQLTGYPLVMTNMAMV